MERFLKSFLANFTAFLLHCGEDHPISSTFAVELLLNFLAISAFEVESEMKNAAARGIESLNDFLSARYSTFKMKSAEKVPAARGTQWQGQVAPRVERQKSSAQQLFSTNVTKAGIGKVKMPPGEELDAFGQAVVKDRARHCFECLLPGHVRHKIRQVVECGREGR